MKPIFLLISALLLIAIESLAIRGGKPEHQLFDSPAVNDVMDFSYLGDAVAMIEIYQTVPGEDKVLKSFCSGSLIGEKTILTAAHCIGSTSKRSVFKLEIHFSPNNNQPRGFSSLAETWHIHPDAQLEPLSPDHDIAVIHLSNSPGRAPLELATEPLLAHLTNDYMIFIAGYGLTVPDDETSYGFLRYGFNHGLFYSSDQVLMIGDHRQRFETPCRGDSGGPAMLTKNSFDPAKKFKLYGVFSYLESLDSCDGAKIYVAVPGNLDFILPHLKGGVALKP